MNDEHSEPSKENNFRESDCGISFPDPGMIASATGMRARDPWEMEQPARRCRTCGKVCGADGIVTECRNISYAKCELCDQHLAAAVMTLYRLQDKKLVRTDDRDWECKAGIRHICPGCIFTITSEHSPS